MDQPTGEFYLRAPNEQVSQGDIYMVPTTVAWSADSCPEEVAKVSSFKKG
jgi:hypothetical protein